MKRLQDGGTAQRMGTAFRIRVAGPPTGVHPAVSALLP